MTFCKDVDLLHWEPNLFRDAAFASQALMGGTGDLAGTTFTVSAGSLAASHVVAGGVIVLSGSVAGSFPIVSIDSATQLTLSVLYDQLYPDEGAGTASPVGTAAGLTFSVRTFWAQRKVVSDLLLQAAGIVPGTEEAATASVLNPEALRRACVLGTLQMIYNALAAVGGEAAAELGVRSDLYERLYRRAVRQAKVELDLDGDGVRDVRRVLDVVRFCRV